MLIKSMGLTVTENKILHPLNRYSKLPLRVATLLAVTNACGEGGVHFHCPFSPCPVC